MKKGLTYAFIIFNSLLCAMVYKLFVFPNGFAPAGVGGICTMIQYIFDFNIGYMTLLINIPLSIAVYLLVSKFVAIRAMVYCVFFSIFSIVLGYVDVSALLLTSQNSAILGALAGGVIMGWSCASLLKVSSHQAGVYFISSLVRKRRPDFNFSWVSFSINIGVAVISVFVYRKGLEPLVLSIIYFFASSMVNDLISKGAKSAIRFEIVTQDPEGLREAIVKELHHSATVLPGKGLYQGQETSVVICIINKAQAPALAAIIKNHPHTFAAVSQVGEVIGNFKRLDNHGAPEKHLMDSGDCKV